MIRSLSIILSAILLLTACSSKNAKTDAAEKLESLAASVAETPKPAHAMPPQNGAFMRDGDTFRQIAAGDVKALMPTNADRGFGFSFPEGQYISSETREFTVQSAKLHPELVQITAFRGITANTPRWSDEVSDENVAWLAAAVVPAKTEVIQRQNGTVDIHLDAPLEPGFYVIHDDTLIRGRQTEDVTEFYPFVVMSGKHDVWAQAANTCIQALTDKYGTQLPLTPPDDALMRKLQKCAQNQRLAIKSVRDNEKRIQTFQRHLAWMERLAFPQSVEASADIRRLMDKDGSDFSNSLWQTVQSDDLAMLKAIYEASKNGETPDSAFVRQILADDMATHETFSISALSWLVFASIDTQHAQPLFDLMAKGGDYQSDLIAWIGAIHWRRLTTLANRDKSVSAFVQKLKSSIHPQFVSLASSISLIDSKDKVKLGPFRFENVPNNEISAWQATLLAKKKAVESCIKPDSVRDNVTLILTQPLTSSGFGPQKSGTLRDPIDTLRSVPVIAPEAVSCILKQFSQLPANPSLDDDQSVQLAVTIVKR